MRKKALLCVYGTFDKYTAFANHQRYITIINSLWEQYDVEIYGLNIVDHIVTSNDETEPDYFKLLGANYTETIVKNQIMKKLQYKRLYQLFQQVPITAFSGTIKDQTIELLCEDHIGNWLTAHNNGYDIVIVMKNNYYMSESLNNVIIEEAVNNNKIVYTTNQHNKYGYTPGFYIGSINVIIKVLQKIRVMHTVQYKELCIEKILENILTSTDIVHKYCEQPFCIIANKKIQQYVRIVTIAETKRLLFEDLQKQMDMMTKEVPRPRNTLHPISKNMKKRVALCFFGVIPRSLRYTANMLYKQIIIPLRLHFQTEIFAFNIIPNNTMVDAAPNRYADIDLLEIDDYEDMLQSNFDIHELQPFIKTGKMHIDNYYPIQVINAVRQLYAESRVSDWLRRHKTDYDAVVVCGPDYFPVTSICIDDVKACMDNLDTVYTSDINDAQGYTNGFYIGHPEPIIKVMDRYKFIHEYMPCNKDYEYILKWAFEKHGIQRVVTYMRFFRIRNSKRIARHGAMNAEEFTPCSDTIANFLTMVDY